MIHYTPEGGYPKIGLNITCGTWRKPWITFRWVSFDFKTKIATSHRIRFRTFMRPFILTSRDEYHVIKDWMWSNDFMAVPKTLLEDESPRILALASMYEKLDYPSTLDGVSLSVPTVRT